MMRLAIVTAMLVAVLTSAPIVCAAERDGTEVAQRPRARGGGGRRGTEGFDARTLIRAEVATVDHDTGRVTMTAGDTRLDVTLAAAVVADMKPGDVVFVTVNVIDTKLAAITGSVTAVDHERGTATLATPGGPVTIPLAPEKLNDIKPGDSLLLKLDVIDIGPPPSTGAPRP